MVVKDRDEGQQATENPVYGRLTELKAFDDTKLGVKGLVDYGIPEAPRIFHNDPQLNNISGSLYSCCEPQLGIPIIDLEGIDKDGVNRAKVVGEIAEACENWGFFQVVNHGILVSVMDEMIDGMRKFHEQDDDFKKRFYSRDYATQKVL